MEKNIVNFIHSEGRLSNWWYAQNMEPIVGKSTNMYDKNLSASILPEKIIGRAKTTVVPEEPVEEPVKEPDTVDVVLDPSIRIYKDTFDRICANCKGDVSYSATMTVYTQDGQNILSIPVIGYHTTIDQSIPSGTYYVKVESDDRLQIKQIVIK